MTIRILAIDDSPTMRGLLASGLEPGGFEVHLADDGIDARERLGPVDPPLVITDVNMPRLDGLGVIEGVRRSANHACIPIFVLTTEQAADLKDRARRAGATGRIVKPFDADRLIDTVNRVTGL